ncbi:NAD(P)/FAD-dependent oxidoreductase [Vineibacter terrae]|uniref:NAD(P)/FAD-dependent oxidoreductase n=1 Tax=Vineibacter terrae TaxID=2586908 RepID=A0A5C8PCN2_9HYPH|nr:FAD-dependent oxidoreductase [Vineibacter terrae]TXL71509.1 NAD(P)/FAD-dependent oxidoreductase [Vineibacter terrae]
MCPSPAPPRLVVAGNGMAAHRLLERLAEDSPQRWSITVFGAEPRANYNRILLSTVLSGEKSAADVMDTDAAWFSRRGITFHAGVAITSIDRERRIVHDAAGGQAAYDHLVLATGSDAVQLPLPGKDLDGVRTFRDLDDVEHLIAATRTRRRAVVIGGGLLGLEAAWGLRQRGLDVTVVHLMGHLMERQLDRTAALYLQRDLERRGIRFALRADTAAIEGEGRVEAVRLRDGRRLATDLVVMAVGVRPNVALARAAGLAVRRGVLVDDALATSDTAISAIGECVEHAGQVYGLVAPAWAQADVLAARLAGNRKVAYRGSIVGTNLKVAGVAVYAAGDIAAADGAEEAVCADPDTGLYRKVVLRDGRLAGAVLVGDAADGGWLFDLMQRGEPVLHLREPLVLGRAFAEPARQAA